MFMPIPSFLHSIGAPGSAAAGVMHSHGASSIAHDLSLLQDASGGGVSQDQQATDTHHRSTRGRW